MGISNEAMMNRIAWMQESILLKKQKKQLLERFTREVIDLPSLFREIDSLIGVLEKLMQLSSNILSVVDAIVKSGKADDLDRLQQMQNTQRSILYAYQVGMLRNLKRYLSGEIDTQKFATEGLTRVAAIYATSGENVAIPYMDFFKEIVSGQTVQWYASRLATLLVEEDQAHAHDHTSTIVVSRKPDGSGIDIKDGKVVFVPTTTAMPPRPAAPVMVTKPAASPTPTSTITPATPVIAKPAGGCPSCGGEVELNMCMDCGAKICTNCGAANQSLVKCERCGFKML